MIRGIHFDSNDDFSKAADSEPDNYHWEGIIQNYRFPKSASRFEWEKSLCSWTPCSSDIRCCCHSNGNTVTCLRGAPPRSGGADSAGKSLQNHPLSSFPSADSHRNAECRLPVPMFWWGISASDLVLVPIRAWGFHRPKMAVCGATCSTCPSAVAHTRRARRTARCAHRTPRGAVKRMGGRHTHHPTAATTTTRVAESSSPPPRRGGPVPTHLGLPKIARPPLPCFCNQHGPSHFLDVAENSRIPRRSNVKTSKNLGALRAPVDFC